MEEEPVAGPSSRHHEPILIPPETELGTSQKPKRKRPSLATTPKPVKKGKPVPVVDLEGENEANQDPSESDDDDDIGPKCEFSIHKILYDETNLKSPLEKIREIMKTVKHSSRASYEELGHGQEIETDEDVDDISYGFSKVAFVQTIQTPNELLHTFGFQKGSEVVYAEKTHNVIIFFYRNNGIYAITKQRSWTHIQRDCCYEFPQKISARLTTSVGNKAETLRSITGNKVSTRHIKKKATEHDELTYIHTNVTKEIRVNSSIMNLKGFKQKGKRMTPKMRIGLAYIRFEQLLAPKHLPEILDHLSKICRDEKTFTVAGDEETDNHIPLLSSVSVQEKSLLEEKLMSIIYEFLCKSDSARMRELEICDKHFEDFGLATGYQLIFKDSKIVFSSWPTAEEVFRAVKKFPEIKEGGLQECARKLSKVCFQFEVGKKVIKRKLIQVVEVELPDPSESGGAFWKILGGWASVKEPYYEKMHCAFIKTLQEGVLMRSTDVGQLPPWDSQFKTLQDYLEKLDLYENNHFIYENEDQVNHEMFDIMFIPPGRRGPIYLYYLFNVFNAGIRGASIRMANAVNLFQNKTNDPHKDLVAFFQTHHDRLQPRFGTFEKFVNHLMGDNVILVAAFRPALPKNEKKVGDQLVDDEFDGFSAEAKVKIYFTLENIQELVVEKMRESMQYGPGLDAQMLLNGLRQSGFCSDEGTATEDGQYPVSGKLLRLRSSEKFKIFEKNAELDKKVFSLVKKHFVGFQGLIPKLEVLEISKLGGAGKVKIADILLK